jgi:putative ABC transport system permease protein
MLPTEGATEQALELETPAGVVALREAMAERLDRDAVVMLGTVLSAGAAVAFAVTWMSTLARRTDLGRRRALGSTRTVAVVMVLLQTGAAALLGAGAGVLAGTAFAAHAAGRAPGMGVVVALVVLTVISVLAGCLVPAVVAARADPVRVLRVP